MVSAPFHTYNLELTTYNCLYAYIPRCLVVYATRSIASM